MLNASVEYATKCNALCYILCCLWFHNLVMAVIGDTIVETYSSIGLVCLK